MQREKDTLEKRVTDPKSLNLQLDTNLRRQQNKHTHQIEKLATSRQLTDRTSQEREKKENKKNTGNERNKQKNIVCM